MTTFAATRSRFTNLRRRRRPAPEAPRHAHPWDLDAELVLPRHRPGRHVRQEVTT